MTRSEKTRKFWLMWRNMMTRCYNPKCGNYKYYGARGINVCQRWHTYANFFNDEWEFYQSHIEIAGERNTTIDRINNDGNYEPSNIRYADYIVQANNRRYGHGMGRPRVFIEHDGKILSIRDWSKELNVPYFTFVDRVKKKYPPEKMFFRGRLRSNGEPPIDNKNQLC